MNTTHKGHNCTVKKSSLGPRSHHSVVRTTKQLITMSYYSAMKFGKKTLIILINNNYGQTHQHQIMLQHT